MTGGEPPRRRALLRRIRLVALVLSGTLVALDLVVVFAFGVGRPDRKSAAVPPPALAAGSPVDKRLDRLALVDEHGHPTSLGAFRGKYVVLAPSLTLCHEVCPLTTGALMHLRQLLAAQGIAGNVVVAEATVDPWRDSPARVRAFKRRTGADLRFLTGTRSEIRRLWKFFGVDYRRVPQGHPADVDWWTHRPERFDVEHTDGLFIIDPSGHWRVAVAGMPDVGGRLSGRLASLLNDEGKANLRHPDLPWTADQVLADLLHLMGRAPPTTQPAGGGRAGRLVQGGTSVVKSRLASLRGRPVVVNEWASWCPPCQQEFPVFAATAARYADRVTFLGLDVNDSASNARRFLARRFLARHPVGYPSYTDDGGRTATSLASFVGLPTTVFIDAAGKVARVHAGQYHDAAALAADIERYALQGTR